MMHARWLVTAAMFVCALLLSAGVAAAGDVRGVTNFGGGQQIWIDAGAYDSKSAEFVQDTGEAGNTLSGSAYYCPTVSTWDDIQKWYMEYSINPTEVPSVNLSGTWYFYARVYQPDTPAPGDRQANLPNDSDYLLVRGDPGDGTGASWYTDALAGLNNDDDRIFNDIWHSTSDPKAGLDQSYDFSWKWYTNQNFETPTYTSKEFNLEDGKITFRINEREGHPYNVRFDALVWSNVDIDAYFPTDADYVAVPEPASLSLLLVGAVGLIRRRRR